MVQRLGVDRSFDPEEVVPAPHEKRVSLLSVGRLHSVKNYRFLVEACAALRDQGLDFVCCIAGEGPERLALERQIEQRCGWNGMFSCSATCRVPNSVSTTTVRTCSY